MKKLKSNQTKIEDISLQKYILPKKYLRNIFKKLKA